MRRVVSILACQWRSSSKQRREFCSFVLWVGEEAGPVAYHESSKETG